MILHKVIEGTREAPRRIRGAFAAKPRNLRNALKEQSTEEYWRRRGNPRSRKLRPAYYKPGVEALADGVSRYTTTFKEIIRSAIKPVLMALVIGFIFLGTAVTAEFFLDRHVWHNLIPPDESLPSLDSFPILATQVSASLLGFYLASVSIVLGTSYQDVSAGTRDLVLGSPRIRIYLASVGMAIGGGLTLVLLQSLEFPYGYLTVGVYVLTIIASGWSFIQLAFGAFRLFDPTALSEEPLIGLYRAFRRLEAKSLKDDAAALRSAARDANRDLLILAELIGMMSTRVSVDRGRLANMVVRLLIRVQFYAQTKHVLSPTSAWFIRQPAYPRWVEASESEVSIALRTSTSLQGRWEPSVDWVERRSAELASAAVEACIVADDRDSALLITNYLAETAYSLARYHRIDEAITFSRIIKERCWGIQETNPAAIAVMSAPPMVLVSLLLGWQDAILDWPNEVRRTVSETKWDRRNTSTAPIRGSQRVRETAQRLLRQIKSEQDVEGCRMTPNWALEVALAEACIISLREVAKELSEHLGEFLTPNPGNPLPEANAMSGLQGLQALAKAQLVADSLPEAMSNLDSLLLGNDREQGDEIEALATKIAECRSEILGGIAGTIVHLRPSRSKSEPDLFGQSLFTLVHHAEEAIAKGDISLVKEVFPQTLWGSLVLEEHLRATYQAPTYRVTAAIFDPTVDILELSGIAMVYASLRGDQSDQPVIDAWKNQLSSLGQTDAATRILNVLEIVDGYPSMGISHRSIARTGWEMRLSREIEDYGYAHPEFHTFEEEPRHRNAPPLIEILGISGRGGRMFLKPRTVFAAEVIGPLSGESEEVLRSRQGLRYYYQKKGRYTEWESPDHS